MMKARVPERLKALDTKTMRACTKGTGILWTDTGVLRKTPYPATLWNLEMEMRLDYKPICVWPKSKRRRHRE